MKRRILIVLAGATALLGVSWGAGYAAWVAASSGNASAKALSMPAGNAVTAPGASNGSITLTWTAATLAGADLTVYTVRRYPAAGGSGTVLACTTQTIANHVVTCTYTEATPGAYQFTNTPQHANWTGAESAKSGTTVVALADTTAPNVTINPVGAVTNNDKPAFTGAYGTAAGDNPLVAVVVRSGSITGPVVASPLATLASATSTWSTPALGLALPNGSYVATATQTDAAGNSKTASTSFVVDTVKPAPVVTSPANGATGVANGTVTISGTAGTATGDTASVSVAVTIDGQTATVTATVTNGTWSITQGIGNKKAVSVSVTQTDWAGNSGTGTSIFNT